MSALERWEHEWSYLTTVEGRRQHNLSASQAAWVRKYWEVVPKGFEFPKDDGSLSPHPGPKVSSYLSLKVIGQDGELLAELLFGTIHPDELPDIPHPRVGSARPWEERGWRSAVHVSAGYLSSTFREIENSLCYRSAIQFGLPLYPIVGGRCLLTSPPLNSPLYSNRQFQHTLSRLHMHGFAGGATLAHLCAGNAQMRKWGSANVQWVKFVSQNSPAVHRFDCCEDGGSLSPWSWARITTPTTQGIVATSS